jgi:hypothetical protein
MKAAEKLLVENDLFAELKAGVRGVLEYIYFRYHMPFQPNMFKLVQTGIVVEKQVRNHILKLFPMRAFMDATLGVKSYLHRIE